MSNISPTRSSSPAAQRMRRYRKQQRQGLRSTPAAVRMRRYRKERRLGLRWLRIPLDVTDIDAFIRLGLLKEDQRQDEEALRTAVMTLVYRAEDDLA